MHRSVSIARQCEEVLLYKIQKVYIASLRDQRQCIRSANMVSLSARFESFLRLCVAFDMERKGVRYAFLKQSSPQVMLFLKDHRRIDRL